MTIPFTPTPGGPGAGWPHWGGTITVPNPSVDPFAFRRAPSPAGIRVVKVTENNLAAIAWRVLQASGLAVAVPNSRDTIVIGGTRYDVGEWIVEEQGKTSTYKDHHSYRHVTQAEVDLYSLED